MTPKEWRKEQKLTLEQLSNKMGFAIGYISEVENGIKDGSLRLIKAYQEISEGRVSYDDFPVPVS